MSTRVHIINVGQGNMILIETANGDALLCDCNVTSQNAPRVLTYLRQVLRGRRIYAFINTHRDADHLRGVNRVHRAVGIDRVWDSGIASGNIFSPEYSEYMRMRRAVSNQTLEALTYFDFGMTRIRVLSAALGDLPADCNAKSIVLKIEHGCIHNSILLTGDSDTRTWRTILERYRANSLAAEILLASHHGSWSFFDFGQEGYHYAAHIRAISPAMTIVSVGPNVHDHPDRTAMMQYEYYSRGSVEDHRVWRTDRDGTMRLELSDREPWVLRRWQDAHLINSPQLLPLRAVPFLRSA